jgi:TetR/AcrR family transcriptional regulator, transcriptional repressor for nem operon
MSKKQNTRDRIVQSAAKLFRANGYVSTGIDAVMADAGLTAGAFYSHFKSKDALFAEILPFASKQAQGSVLTSATAPSHLNASSIRI